MRVSTMIRISSATKQEAGNPDGGLMDRITGFARQAEARGFPGIWIGDSLGRGRPTLDSLQVLTALAAVTSKIELGISVLQLPLRNPIELAHRVQSLQAMSNNRLILGVGSGSTRDDFELLGYDYDHRFRTFKNDLEIMNRAWTASRSTAVRCQLAGMQGRPANPDRRLAQPPLDHLCRQRSPGLEPLRPVQQLGRFRTRHEDL